MWVERQVFFKEAKRNDRRDKAREVRDDAEAAEVERRWKASREVERRWKEAERRRDARRAEAKERRDEAEGGP